MPKKLIRDGKYHRTKKSCIFEKSTFTMDKSCLQSNFYYCSRTMTRFSGAQKHAICSTVIDFPKTR